MNTMKKAVMTLVLGFVMVGCNDLSTPESTLGSAYKALSKEKVKTFKRTLTGEALEQYGNITGMAAIIAELKPLDVKIGETKLLKQEFTKHGMLVGQLFDVNLLAREKSSKTQSADYAPFKSVTIDCEVSYVYNNTGGWSWDLAQDCYFGPQGNFCRPGPRGPFFPVERAVQRCQIAKIQAI